jgi:arsenite methyltransferase
VSSSEPANLRSARSYPDGLGNKRPSDDRLHRRAQPIRAATRRRLPLTETLDPPVVDLEELRASIRVEYAAVAAEPDRGFHFHTGHRLAAILGYRQDWIETLPPGAVASMAGTGNPFALGEIHPGERVVDCGSGAGADALIAARLVGPSGRVIGIDMTPAMLAKARTNTAAAGLTNVEFREGILEALPVETGRADVVISDVPVRSAE